MKHPRPEESGDPQVDAQQILRWARGCFGDRLVVTASFGDATLPHLVGSAIPGTPIVLLDTGYLFAETEWFADHLRERFGLDLRVVRPDERNLDRDVWRTDPDACCRARKVEPLNDVLADADAWVTGLRRSDSDARVSTPLVHDDLLRGVVKINPLAGWSDADVEHYAAQHDLPAHPLADREYGSIGCWPCTKPSTPGDPRSGRWAGSTKTECGLHVG